MRFVSLLITSGRGKIPKVAAGDPFDVFQSSDWMRFLEH